VSWEDRARRGALSPRSASHGTTLLAAILRACAREERGVRALARAVGVSPETLHRVLLGRMPGRHVRRALAAYLGVAPSQVAAWASEHERSESPPVNVAAMHPVQPP